MEKYDYPMEDAINDMYDFLGIEHKDAWAMTESEIDDAVSVLEKTFKFVEHPDYSQWVPMHIETGKIVPEVMNH